MKSGKIRIAGAISGHAQAFIPKNTCSRARCRAKNTRPPQERCQASSGSFGELDGAPVVYSREARDQSAFRRLRVVFVQRVGLGTVVFNYPLRPLGPPSTGSPTAARRAENRFVLVQRVLVTTDLPSWDLQLRSDPPSYALGACFPKLRMRDQVATIHDRRQTTTVKVRIVVGPHWVSFVHCRRGKTLNERLTTDDLCVGGEERASILCALEHPPLPHAQHSTHAVFCGTQHSTLSRGPTHVGVPPHMPQHRSPTLPPPRIA